MILKETSSTVLSDATKTNSHLDAWVDGWSDALRMALADRSQPHVVFQPIVDLRRGVIAGYETLARFGSTAAPSPDLWFAAADRIGVAAQLEARVLRKAIQARDQLPRTCFLTVNVMPHLLTTPEVAEVWLDADLSGVVLELNETVCTEQRAADLTAATQAVRDRGGCIAMDDVGSGYAGLRQIARIRPELVKLDRDLVAHADADQVRRTLTELVNVFASRLDTQVIAEGIERDEELAMLVRLGIPLGQGWYLGRPADTWQRLDPAISRRIRLLAQRTERGDGVGSLLEQVRIFFGDDHPRRDAAAAATRRPGVASQSRTPGAGAAIVVNRRRHPVALELPGPHGGAAARRIPASMLAHPDEPVAEVARRAMSRTACHRLDPVVVVTEMGRPVGLVRVERLILRLAEMAGSYPYPLSTGTGGPGPRMPSPSVPGQPGQYLLTVC
jgi:EAL domain-containing protein (putative c-di-GMP-specific phosphodiesterase class I)